MRRWWVLAMSWSIRFPLLGLVAVILGGCVFFDVKEQQEKLGAFCSLSGTVASEGADDTPLVVILVRKEGHGDQLEDWSVFDHFVLERSGRWVFGVNVGQYGFAAFEDVNGNLIYQPGEPFLQVDLDSPITCKAGDEIRDIELIIPRDGRPRIDGPIDVAALQTRTVHDQMRTSIGLVTAVGDVVSLSDPRFSPENARNGMWRPFDFLFEAKPGIYLLEPYDPDKIPVLFVHGVQGTPRNFEYLIDNLDRDIFQPIVYYYPSGISFAALAEHLDQTMIKLRRRHGFEKTHVVAHSAGGLVSRAFVFNHRESLGAGSIPTLLTIATPWDGHEAAGRGVERAPAVVDSWRDLAPGSQFLTELFSTGSGAEVVEKDLPDDVTHHLLFAFRRDPGTFGPSDDETITVDSQLRWEAQEDAGHRIYGFNETHVGVLKSEEVANLINDILANGAK